VGDLRSKFFSFLSTESFFSQSYFVREFKRKSLEIIVAISLSSTGLLK